MADVNRGNRPLSPHLQIYRPQLNSATSILNRITGIALLGGTFLVVAWLVAAASSEWAFGWVDWALTSVLGDLVMSASVLALWYHALGGVRHLIWDMGYGLDPHFSDKMGWAMIIGSVVLTAVSLLILWGM